MPPNPITLAELGGAPTIDVHGFDIKNAIYEIDAFCEREWARGELVVKVVHGRGSGKLREGILRWANDRSDLRIQDSTVPSETGAVLYIALMNSNTVA